MALNRSDSPKPGVLTPRRVTLLASVAALGATVLLAGPGGYQPSGLTSPAHATETWRSILPVSRTSLPR